MRSMLLALTLCGAQIFLFTFSSHAAVAATLSEQAAENIVAAQHSFGFFGRSANTACVPTIMLDSPEVLYVEPDAGHAPSWYVGSFDHPFTFQANIWPPQNSPSDFQERTKDMQAKPWQNGDAAIREMAKSMPLTSSWTHSKWVKSVIGTAAPSGAEDVTAIGRTYRPLRQDIDKRPGNQNEPQRFNERVIFCR
jgi:hypothetical protein